MRLTEQIHVLELRYKIIDTGIVGAHAAAQAVIHNGTPTPAEAIPQPTVQAVKQPKYITPGAVTPGILPSANSVIAGTAILLRLFAILGKLMENRFEIELDIELAFC
ncbi:MAG: hypothetical protein K1000chlam2_00634 [Chlamydiae bacterium]|nr:hypothetical protein [Chlamydiota bacterium]